MPNHSKGPRLWLRKRKGFEPLYVILDGKKMRGTGCGAHESERAREVLAAYLAESFRPNTRERDLAAISCAEVLMMYAQDQPADKPSLKLIGYSMKALLPFWGDKSLADVKGSTCRKYAESRSKKFTRQQRSENTIKPSTVRRELKTLQAAINHWHRESPLAAVPTLTLPPEGGRRERVLERSEVARLLWAARRLHAEHVARFILIGVYTGTRHDAILKLRWADSLTGGHADLNNAILYRRGRVERETSKRRPPTKIRRSLLCHMARWKSRDDGNDQLSVIHHRGRPILKMKRAWASVVKAAGLGPDVTPHTLRHTCASWLLWEGKTIWDVAGIIGADASTVDRVYGHHRSVEQERARA